MPKDSITYKKYEGLPYEIGRFILAPTEAIKMYSPLHNPTHNPEF